MITEEDLINDPIAKQEREEEEMINEANKEQEDEVSEEDFIKIMQKTGMF